MPLQQLSTATLITAAFNTLRVAYEHVRHRLSAKGWSKFWDCQRHTCRLLLACLGRAFFGHSFFFFTWHMLPQCANTWNCFLASTPFFFMLYYSGAPASFSFVLWRVPACCTHKTDDFPSWNLSKMTDLLLSILLPRYAITSVSTQAPA